MNNKLFCTFTTQDDIEKTIIEVKSSYDILYKKIFVLYIKSNDEYVCTYNVEPSSVEAILPNTILVHRKKESNKVNWQHYKNTILLTQHNELKQLKTRIHQILEL